MMNTLGLGEASSRPAAQYVAVPASARPHLWDGDRCRRCEMHAGWDGARLACTGIRERPSRAGKGRGR